jgi:hypothetical protein
MVREHRHQCAVVTSCTRIINADAAKAQRLLYQRRRKAIKISTKVSCEICARPLSAAAASTAIAPAAASSPAAGVLTFGCGHIFHGTRLLAARVYFVMRFSSPADACLFAAIAEAGADAAAGRGLWCVICRHQAKEAAGQNWDKAKHALHAANKKS